MTTNLPLDVVLQFIGKINEHDAQGLANLMTDDHVFVDSMGDSVKGRDEMHKAWITYFFLFPDFTIHCTEMFEKESVVVLIGTARGTYSQGSGAPGANAWQIPAAWRAVVRGNRIAEWRIFADNEPVRQIVSAQQNP